MVDLIAILVLSSVVGGILVYGVRKSNTNTQKTVDLLAGLAKRVQESAAQNNPATTPMPDSELGTRVAAVERRVEELAADALRYYKKADARLRRMRQLEGDIEEEEEEEEVSPEVARAAHAALEGQEEMAFPDERGGNSEAEALDYLRSLIHERRR